MGRLERRLDDDAIARARLKLGKDEPTLTRRESKPRAAETYRGARRNAARDAGQLGAWRANNSARVVPYRTKPPKIKFVLDIPHTSLGKQPKGYAIKLTGEDGVTRQYARDHAIQRCAECDCGDSGECNWIKCAA